MSSHTKGPWHLQELPLGNEGNLEPTFRISGGSTLNLEVSPCADGYVPRQNEANARLIAAAPAYKVAWYLVPDEIKRQIFSFFKAPGVDLHWIAQAIAKAEGSDPR